MHDVDDPTIEDDKKLKDEEKLVESTSGYNEVDDEQEFASSSLVGDDGRAESEDGSPSIDGTKHIEKNEARPRTIPPPGTGKRIYEIDPLLNSHREHLDYR